jgi:ABC-type polysaccharide/polyol phosphate export permease
MLDLLRILSRRRDLLFMLTLRDIKVKYKQSIMGVLWAILMPLVITAAGVVVKVGLARVSGRPVRVEEIVGVSVKALPWAFFVSSIRFSTSCLASNATLVTKIAFPRAVFPLSAVASQLFDLAIASSLLVVVLGFAPGVHVTPAVLWAPLLLVLLVVQVSGLALLLSAANLFFRDVKYIVEVVLTFAIFFTPVFYDSALFGRWGQLLLLNPIAPILEGLSASVAGRGPAPGWTLYSAGWALALLVVAPAWFRRLEPKFAESV